MTLLEGKKKNNKTPPPLLWNDQKHHKLGLVPHSEVLLTDYEPLHLAKRYTIIVSIYTLGLF